MNESTYEEWASTRRHLTLEHFEGLQEGLPTDALDGGDMIGVMITVADYLEMDLLEFIDTQLARDLVESTQSNADEAMEIIGEWAIYDRIIAEKS